jgi:hypothetical protein
MRALGLLLACAGCDRVFALDEVRPPPDVAVAGAVIEAEAYASSTGGWVLDNAVAGFTGDGFMRMPSIQRCETIPLTLCPRLTYAVHVSERGSYFAYLRMYASDDSSNSAFVGVDDTPLTDTVNVAFDSTWWWATAGSVVLDMGPHVLSVWQREGNARIDAVALTMGTP